MGPLRTLPHDRAAVPHVRHPAHPQPAYRPPDRARRGGQHSQLGGNVLSLIRDTDKKKRPGKTSVADCRKVIPLGFEPKTHSLEGCCSIQLSYGTIGQRLWSPRCGHEGTKIFLKYVRPGR